MLNKFNSNVRKLNRINPKIHPNNLNGNPFNQKNNKNTISDFHNEIFIHSARYIKRRIDTFNDIQNTLTIYNAVTDYGTEGASVNNFEVIVSGLHIPGDYIINDVGNNVVITLGGRYIDFDNIMLDDIYVIGKLINI